MVSAALALTSILTLIASWRMLRECRDAERRMDETRAEWLAALPKNPYAHLLGREVTARKYEAADWQRCVVVCVSWKGAVRVRPVANLAHGGWWVHKTLVAKNVRED